MNDTEELTAENCNDVIAACRVRTEGRCGPCSHWSSVSAYPLGPVPPEMMTAKDADRAWHGDHWSFSPVFFHGVLSTYSTWLSVAGSPRAWGFECVLELRRRGFFFRATSSDCEEGAMI
jgi:hypothetical protein